MFKELKIWQRQKKQFFSNFLIPYCQYSIYNFINNKINKMSKPQEKPNNGEKPIRDIVKGPDFIYIENSDQRPKTLETKTHNIKK